MPFVQNAQERQGLILSQREAQVEFKSKIMKNKDSRDMGYEDLKVIEKDEDKRLIDEEFEKEDRMPRDFTS